MTEIETSILTKLAACRFPPGTASKRFVLNFHAGYMKELSGRGRSFLAFIAHRFRAQCNYSEAEEQWIKEWR